LKNAQRIGTYSKTQHCVNQETLIFSFFDWRLVAHNIENADMGWTARSVSEPLPLL